MRPNQRLDPTRVLGEVVDVETYTAPLNMPNGGGPPISMGERTHTTVRAKVIASGSWEYPEHDHPDPAVNKRVSRETRPVDARFAPGETASFGLGGEVVLEPGTVVLFTCPLMMFGEPTLYEVIADYDSEADYLTPDYYLPLELSDDSAPRGLFARLRSWFGG